MAEELGDCTASTINKWERGMHAIPNWVEEKLMRTVDLTLPLAEIRDLIDAAIDAQQPFEVLLAEAVREWLAKRHETKNIRTVMGQPKAQPLKATPSAQEDTARVAEDETPYGK